MKVSKRQLQVSELIKRNFGIVLQQEGPLLFGETFVTVTQVVMSPDLGIAKIYVSVYNALDKQAVIIIMNENKTQLRQDLAFRIRKHIRRIPEVDFYIDETLDEMERLNSLFDKLHDENQM
jgi:ribosome-binding factor A